MTKLTADVVKCDDSSHSRCFAIKFDQNGKQFTILHQKSPILAKMVQEAESQ